MFNEVELAISESLTDDGTRKVILFCPRFSVINSLLTFGCIACNLNFALGSAFIFPLLNERFSQGWDDWWDGFRTDNVFPETASDKLDF